MKTTNKKDIIITAIIVALVVYIATREFTLYQVSKNPDSQSQNRNSESTSPQSPLQKSNSQDANPYEKEQVKNTLTKSSKEFQSCYLDYLKSKPARTSVQIKVDWQIQNNGNATNVEVINSTDETLGKCLVSKIKDITFPPPPEGRPYYIAHTFSFKTVEQLEKEIKEREEMEKKFAPKTN